VDPRPEADAALDQAVRWLSRREYSVSDLERRLRDKGFEQAVVNETLAFLQSHDLVSDQRFAESLVRNRTERGYGPVKIAHELRAKGVDDATVEQVLTDNPDHWVARLREVWEKRFGEPPDSYREWARQARALQSRGFTVEQVRRVIPDIEPSGG